MSLSPARQHRLRIQAEQAARFTQWLLLVLAGVGLLGRAWS